MLNRERKPIAIIGFSSAASPLVPAWPATHRALLPIAGKALIVHLVEQLAAAGIRHLRVAGSIQQYAVRQRLRNGEEWGMTVRYSDLHETDLRTQTLFETGDCLYFCGDNLHIGEFSSLRATGAAKVANPAKLSGQSAYWALTPSGPTCHGLAAVTGSPHIRHPILTVPSYHQANLDVATHGGGLLLPGRALKPGVIVDWDTYIAPDANLGEHVTIGKHCRIGSRVQLDAGCILANGIVVGRDAHLRNVSVLPNTYVGSGTRLRDAVITPVGLFDFHGRFVASPDPSVIGRARSNEEDLTGIPSERLSALETRNPRSPGLFPR